MNHQNTHTHREGFTSAYFIEQSFQQPNTYNTLFQESQSIQEQKQDAAIRKNRFLTKKPVTKPAEETIPYDELIRLVDSSIPIVCTIDGCVQDKKLYYRQFQKDGYNYNYDYS